MEDIRRFHEPSAWKRSVTMCAALRGPRKASYHNHTGNLAEFEDQVGRGCGIDPENRQRVSTRGRRFRIPSSFVTVL